MRPVLLTILTFVVILYVCHILSYFFVILPTLKKYGQDGKPKLRNPDLDKQIAEYKKYALRIISP